MKITLLPLLLFVQIAFGQPPSNETPTYRELIDAYEELAAEYPEAELTFEGATDSREELPVFVIDSKKQFNPKNSRDNNQLVTLIINGIHPGEACGINASLEFAREILEAPSNEVVYVIVPIYNIGGALNRNSTTRANQNGPRAYGFRGNGKNLDLNRDFIKCDSENALSFARLFHKWQPQIFVDTHTSNGADYQPAITLLTTFPEKLETMQSRFLTMELEPALYEGMLAANEEMIPYVSLKGTTPKEGIKAFTDLPRYSTGYASLFNTIGFMTEAHMLKPFDERVKATLNFLHVLNKVTTEKKDVIIQLKTLADKQTTEKAAFEYDWKITEETAVLSFPGFEADTARVSEVTRQKSLSYNRNQPYREDIAHFKFHEAGGSEKIPAYYIVPQQWQKVIACLYANQIEMTQLEGDTLIDVQSTIISDFKTVDYPYEGHYLHYNTKARTVKEKIPFYAGDYLIRTAQPGKKYLAAVFTAEAEDSFFNWNFFDSQLGQKEYFSTYVFDETADEVLKKNPSLRKAFEAKRESDADFAANHREQLKYIYKNSEYKEKSHMR
ncbi:MAG: hypothetical protein LC664_11470, partial [Flavobacteriales bacterium]|nr:hypothetical protein [Flavobacteriales bacterium]